MAIAVITSFTQQCDQNGVPLNAGTVTVYAAGTTTPLTLYPNSDLTGSANNPVTLDASGRHDMRYIATAAYKVVVKNSAGTPVYTRDNIDPGVAVGSGALPVANGGTGAATAASARTNLAAASSTDMATAQSDISNLNTWTGYSLTTKSRMASGTTAQQPSAGTVGSYRWNSTTSTPEMDNGAAWKKIALEGNIDHTYFASSSGLLCLQRSRTVLTATQAISANIPYDNTIPQIGEGTEVTGFNVTFTPRSASSTIRVYSLINCMPPSGTPAIAALFLNSGANAVSAAVFNQNGATTPSVQLIVRYEHAPGALTAQNYAIRAGSSANTLNINGTVTLGAVVPTELIIEEWITK